MHESASPIGLPTVVVHYPSTEHTSMMIGRVRFGPCAGVVVGLLEVMDIVEGEKEISKAEREDVWGPGTPISPERMPVAPSRLRLFNHHHHRRRRLQNGDAYASLPSSRSSTHTVRLE